jgi:hypothetical protein
VVSGLWCKVSCLQSIPSSRRSMKAIEISNRSEHVYVQWGKRGGSKDRKVFHNSVDLVGRCRQGVCVEHREPDIPSHSHPVVNGSREGERRDGKDKGWCEDGKREVVEGGRRGRKGVCLRACVCVCVNVDVHDVGAQAPRKGGVRIQSTATHPAFS